MGDGVLFTVVGPWIAAGLTLAVMSFLYRDNPLFKFSEHLYVGVSMGYLVVRQVFDVLIGKAWLRLTNEGDFTILIPTVLGLLLLLRFLPKLGWVSRFAFAFLMGTVSGMAIPRFISANILKQAKATVDPLVGSDAAGLFWGPDQINAFVILLGVVTVLVYFIFSVERKNPITWMATVGTYFLMATFGTAFGLTVMGRITLLIGRFEDLITYSGGKHWGATWVMLAAVVLFVAAWVERNPEGGEPIPEYAVEPTEPDGGGEPVE